MCVEKGGLRRTCLCITKGQYTNTYIHKSTPLAFKWLFPDSSVGKESTCDAGDSGSIPGSGRSPEEGIGYALQYSWASLVAQMVKNQPAMKETWVWSLFWDDPLEEGMATHSSILAWRILIVKEAWWATVHGSQRVGHDWMTKHSTANSNVIWINFVMTELYL